MLNTLTKQERRVYNLILQGKRRKEVMDILHISRGTANTYESNIYSKLYVHSKVELLYRRIQELEEIINELTSKADRA